MFRSYFLSWKWAPLAWGCVILILGFLYFQVDTAWRFAEWMKTYGDIISGVAKRYTPNELRTDFIFEGAIIGFLFVVLNAAINYVSRRFCLNWTVAIMFHLLPNWNKTIQDVDSPAERFQNSIEDYTLKLLNMSRSFARSCFVLAKFGPELWKLSDNFNYIYFDNTPGMIIWMVVFISFIGLSISFFVGKNLKKCRKELREMRGYVRSGIEFIQRNKKRDDSIPKMEKLVKDMVKSSNRLYSNQFWFEMWQGGYGQLWAILPVTFFGYNIFSGFVKFGVVAQTTSALGEIIGAFAIFINLFDEYTDFASARERLQELEGKINNPDNWEEAKKEIGWKDRRAGNIVVDIDGKKISLTANEVVALLENRHSNKKE